MKILCVSDEEKRALWDDFLPGKLDGYDLILSCGDLKAEYLTFLVTMGRARLLYVHGNHDEHYDLKPPEGCEDIDGHLVSFNGVRILGLGGCMRYSLDKYQYTEKEMQKRVSTLRRAVRKAGGVDIVIAHAPPRGVGDMEDQAHRGFEAFLRLIDEFRPKYFLHGHTHMRYGARIPREIEYRGTKVINVSGQYEFEIPGGSYTPKEQGEVIWKTKHREQTGYGWDVFRL